MRCLRTTCGLVYQAKPPSAAELAAIYGEDYYVWGLGAPPDAVWTQKVKMSRWLLQSARKHGLAAGSLLDIGCAHGAMLDAARQMGLAGTGIEPSPAAIEAQKRGFNVIPDRVEVADLAGQTFDIVTMIDFIEHVPDPRAVMEQVLAWMRPGAFLVLVTPDVSTRMATILGSRWPEYKLEHLLYFSRKSLTRLLRAFQFEVLLMRKGRKYPNFDYVLGHFRKYDGGLITATLNLIERVMPASLRTVSLPCPMGIFCVARRRSES